MQLIDSVSVCDCPTLLQIALKSQSTPFFLHIPQLIIAMVDVQDGDSHLHKRIAIPQLLNPVSSSPTKRQEEHGFATYRGAWQHSSPSSAVVPDLTLVIQILPLRAHKLTACALRIGDQQNLRLQPLSSTPRPQTPMAAFVGVVPVTQHSILDRGQMTAMVTS